MKIFQIAFIFFVAALAHCNPGVNIRINEAGMDFIRECVEDQTVGYQISTYNYTKFYTPVIYNKVNFSGLHVSYFDIETVELGQSASNQININVVQSNLSFEGNYEIARVILGEITKTSGAIKINDDSVSAEMTLTIDVLENGSTSLHLNNCSIGFVIDPKNVEVENWDSTHKSEFDNFLTNHLNADIVNEFCDNLVQPVISQLNHLLSVGQESFANFNRGTFMIIPGLYLNTSLYEAPVITTNMMEIKLDGTFYPVSQPNIIIPYTRPPLPNFTNSESIAQVAIGIHVLRSLLYSVVEADLVDIPISSDTIPAVGPISLNPESFNALISTYTTFMNNRSLSMRLQMTEVPQIELSDGLVSLNVSIKLATYAVNDDGTQDLAAVFCLIVNASARLSITNNSLSAELTELNLQLCVEPDAPAGEPDGLDTLNFILRIASSSLLPVVNQLLDGGIQVPIPSILYSISDINFSIVKDGMLLSFNVMKSTQPQGVDILSAFNNIPGFANNPQ